MPETIQITANDAAVGFETIKRIMAGQTVFAAPDLARALIVQQLLSLALVYGEDHPLDVLEASVSLGGEKLTLGGELADAAEGEPATVTYQASLEVVREVYTYARKVTPAASVPVLTGTDLQRSAGFGFIAATVGVVASVAIVAHAWYSVEKSRFFVELQDATHARLAKLMAYQALLQAQVTTGAELTAPPDFAARMATREDTRIGVLGGVGAAAGIAALAVAGWVATRSNPDLTGGYSQQAIRANRNRLIEKGYSSAQAERMALTQARRSYRAKHPGARVPRRLNPTAPTTTKKTARKTAARKKTTSKKTTSKKTARKKTARKKTTSKKTTRKKTTRKKTARKKTARKKTARKRMARKANPRKRKKASKRRRGPAKPRRDKKGRFVKKKSRKRSRGTKRRRRDRRGRFR